MIASRAGPFRIIPAWAGNTMPNQSQAFGQADHPRVGGEHDQRPEMLFRETGSSPRGRGTLRLSHIPFRQSRIIPAWAGNTAGGVRQ